MIDPFASLALSGETSKLHAILMSFKMPLGLFGVERLKLPSALRHLRHTVTMVLISSGGGASRDATARPGLGLGLGLGLEPGPASAS